MKRIFNFILLKVVEIVGFAICMAMMFGIYFLIKNASMEIFLKWVGIVIFGALVLFSIREWVLANWKIAKAEKPLKELWKNLWR